MERNGCTSEGPACFHVHALLGCFTSNVGLAVDKQACLKACCWWAMFSSHTPAQSALTVRRLLACLFSNWGVTLLPCFLSFCRPSLVPREAVNRISRGVEAQSRAVGLAGASSGSPRSKL
jgi:hypothetical protein